MQTKKNAGFTIVEMLIVVTILAMLAGILIPVLEDSASSSRDARRAADLKSVSSALEAYKRVNGSFPTTAGAWSVEDGTAGDYGAAGYIASLVPDFLPALPSDPDDSTNFGIDGYAYRSDGTDFKFIAKNTPESFPAGNPFYDSNVEGAATNWQVSSSGGYGW